MSIIEKDKTRSGKRKLLSKWQKKFGSTFHYEFYPLHIQSTFKYDKNKNIGNTYIYIYIR